MKSLSTNVFPQFRFHRIAYWSYTRFQFNVTAFPGPFARTSATCCSRPKPSPPTRTSKSSCSWTGSKPSGQPNSRLLHPQDEGTRLASNGFLQNWPPASSSWSAPNTAPSGTSSSIRGNFLLNCLYRTTRQSYEHSGRLSDLVTTGHGFVSCWAFLWLCFKFYLNLK